MGNCIDHINHKNNVHCFGCIMEQLTKANERIAELEGIIDLYEQQFFPNGFDDDKELHIYVATTNEDSPLTDKGQNKELKTTPE